MSELIVIVCLPLGVALMAVTFVIAMSGMQEVQSVAETGTNDVSH